MIPWNYNCNYVNEATVVNIMGIGGMTRSGRCYAPIATDNVSSKSTEQVSKQNEIEVVPKVVKGQMKERKANEFLKFIKHSEYSVVEQVNKLLA